MVTRLGRVVTRLGRVVTRLRRVVTRFGRVVTRLKRFVTRLGRVVTRLGRVVTRLRRVVTRLGRVVTRFRRMVTRLRKVDSFAIYLLYCGEIFLLYPLNRRKGGSQNQSAALRVIETRTLVTVLTEIPRFRTFNKVASKVRFVSC